MVAKIVQTTTTLNRHFEVPSLEYSICKFTSSHVLHFVRYVVKCRVTVNFVFCGFEQWVGIIGIGSSDVLRFDNPDAHALVAAGIDITGVFNRHFSIGSMKAANVFVVKPAFASDENFPKWPVFFHGWWIVNL